MALARRDNGVPKIAGSAAAFIALIVILSLIILGSCATVAVVLRNMARERRHPHMRQASDSTAPSQYASVLHKKRSTADTQHTRVESGTASMKEKLAGMFAGARSSHRGGRGGWARAELEDPWDAADEPFDPAELGLRHASTPRHSVLVHATQHGQAASERAEASYTDPYAAPGAPPHTRERSFARVSGGYGPAYLPHSAPRAGAPDDAEDSDLSETSTLGTSAGASDRAAFRASRHGNPAARITSPLAGSPSDVDLSDDRDTHDGARTDSPTGLHSPIPTSPSVWTFEGGSRFREAL